MKKSIGKILLFSGIVIALTSCASLGGGAEKPLPASIVKELKEAKTVAVLGYNTSKGLDDRLLDEAIKAPLFEIKLEIVDARGEKFPIGGRVNTYDANFLASMKEGPYKLISKSSVLNSTAYKKIKGDPTSELSNVNAAKGYTLTYQFDNWMDKASETRANKVPSGGQLVNAFKETLEELGADIGIIVVEKPYMYVQRYSLIPDQLFFKKQQYFTVASLTTYYIVKPSTFNQVLHQKTFRTFSDTQYILKGYTPDQRKEDEVTFLEQYDTVSKKNHAEFFTWLNEQLK